MMFWHTVIWNEFYALNCTPNHEELDQTVMQVRRINNKWRVVNPNSREILLELPINLDDPIISSVLVFAKAKKWAEEYVQHYDLMIPYRRSLSEFELMYCNQVS